MEVFLKFEKVTLNPFNKFNFESNEDSLSEEIKALLACVAGGSYVEALKKEKISKIFDNLEQRTVDVTIFSYFKNILLNFMEKNGIEGEQIIYCIGVCCLQLFTQNNFSGPLIGPEPCSLFPGLLPTDKNEEYLHKEALTELILDAEGIYSLVKGPEYLIIARLIFVELKNKLISFPSTDWWCFRYGLIHQKVTDEQSPELHKILMDCIKKLEKESKILNENEERGLTSLFHLEAGHLFLQYYDVANANYHFQKAISILGLEFSLSGALGKRTKWQQHDLAQLVCKVSYKGSPLRADELPGPNLLGIDLPKDILLNDDTRLHHINYKEVDEVVIPNLQPIEQMALLAHLVLTRKSQAADITTNEETKAYLMALLQHPKNWSIQLSALIMRSRLDAGEFRAVERALSQFEELVSSITKEDPSRYERLKLIYASFLMAQWNVEQELARIFMKLGGTKTALEIFEKLHLWEDVIICYNDLQMRQRSADIIKTLLEKEESTKLWCLLGDATDDIECYNKAWALSNEKSGRAQRCLGNYYYVRREYAKAIEHYGKSVSINTLQFPVWQRLAYCSLQVEDWEQCARAYGRCSILEPDNFECWNNMSQAFLKLGQNQKAWKTLQEALRCKQDNWRLWDNYMLVSTSLGYMNQSLNAYNKILQHKPKHVDTEILGRIVSAIIENKKDPDGQELKRLHKKSVELLAKLTCEIPTHPELWFLYAELLFSHPEQNQSNKHTAMQYFRKSVAAATQKTGWDKNTEIVVLVLMRILRLLSVAQEVAAESNAKAAFSDMSSIRMLIRATVESVKRSQTNIETGEIVDTIDTPLKEVERELENMNSFIGHLKFKTTSP